MNRNHLLSLSRRFPVLAAASLAVLLGAAAGLDAAILTGSGAHLPIPAPNPPWPPGLPRNLTNVTGGFTGTWTPPAEPDWVGTYSATGPVPNSAGTGTTNYSFTALPTGALPTGTFFVFGDVDGGSNTNEIFDLQAWDTSGNLITTPWLDEPIAVRGPGTGTAGAILPGNMPGWDWNNVNANTYRIDGTTVTGGNPNVAFALVNNQPITRMELVKASTFNGFHLQAPEVPEPAAVALGMISGVSWVIAARRRRRS